MDMRTVHLHHPYILAYYYIIFCFSGLAITGLSAANATAAGLTGTLVSYKIKQAR